MEDPRPVVPPAAAWTSIDLVLTDGTAIAVGRVPVASRVDLGTVEGLARLQLAARRRGWRLTLHHPSGGACPLSELLDLVGLTAGVSGVVAEAGVLLAGQVSPGRNGGRPNSAKRSS